MDLRGTLSLALRNALYNVTPFQHWLVRNPLTDRFIDQLINDIDIPCTQKIYDGTRSGDVIDKMDKNTSSRLFITPALVAQHTFLRELMDFFLDLSTIDKVRKNFFSNFNQLFLRAEYIYDSDGFYLVPHRDIVEKVFTLFIYIGDSPASCGTDLYDSNKQFSTTIPFKNNTGYIFVPGEDTWHGFEPKFIPAVRRALMLNYVTFKTEWPVL